MARPRKDAPRPDTELVAFRLSRALLVALDAHAATLKGTRTDALRDLLGRGLGTVEEKREAVQPRRRAGRRRRQQSAECVWCLAKPGTPHLAACPHTPGSGLRAMFEGKPKRG